MKLFVSYARVNKPYCLNIVNMLNVHDVWQDQRLYAGKDWWNEILRRLEWCEGFIYLLSPDSVASEYCRREYNLAYRMGKPIFPVLIHPDTELIEELSNLQYVDLSNGLTAEAVGSLLNSLYITERELNEHKNTDDPPALVNLEEKGVVGTIIDELDLGRVVGMAAKAMENGEYDRAVYLLQQAKANGYESRFINIDRLLAEAERALERKTYLREADREYQQILQLIKHKATRQIGLEAFQEFAKAYPDYDPEDIAQLLKQKQKGVPGKPSKSTLPLLEWCNIPEGNVIIDQYDKQGTSRPDVVPAFSISRYPITLQQYGIFINSSKGYGNEHWWKTSPQMHKWWKVNKGPQKSQFEDGDRPREMVNWFEAIAFCNWLSDRLGFEVTLPTVEQRQRSIQGDDDRIFPWGDDFDVARCNTRESGIKMTTKVMSYPNGCSTYHVFDLVGNVWEWCMDTQSDQNGDEKYAVHGGSFVSPYERGKIEFRYYLSPQAHYSSIGFRIVSPSLNI